MANRPNANGPGENERPAARIPTKAAAHRTTDTRAAASGRCFAVGAVSVAMRSMITAHPPDRLNDAAPNRFLARCRADRNQHTVSSQPLNPEHRRDRRVCAQERRTGVANGLEVGGTIVDDVNRERGNVARACPRRLQHCRQTRECTLGLRVQVGSDERAGAIDSKLTGDVDRSTDTHGLRSERRGRNSGRAGNCRFDLRGRRPRAPELSAEACFVPAQLRFAPFPFGGLVFALAPLLVALDLIAIQETAQIAFESVLTILQIFPQLLHSLGVEHRGRAVAAVEPLVHFADRRLRAVTLGARRDHERVVRLRVACRLIGCEVERDPRECRIERSGERGAGQLRRARPVSTGGSHAAAPTVLCLGLGNEDERCGKEQARQRLFHDWVMHERIAPSHYLSRGSLGGLGPCRTAPRTGTQSSGVPVCAQRKSNPPRLMSPRPANVAGKSRRSPKTSRSGPTYLSVATLPSNTTRSSGPIPLWSAVASRTSGSRNAGSDSSTGTVAICCRSSTRIKTSAGRRPRPGAMTNARPNRLA